jgi:hypothetical protein
MSDSRPEESTRRRFHRFPLCISLKVPVHVFGDSDAGMAQRFRYNVEWDALSKHETGCAMTEPGQNDQTVPGARRTLPLLPGRQTVAAT